MANETTTTDAPASSLTATVPNIPANSPAPSSPTAAALGAAATAVIAMTLLEEGDDEICPIYQDVPARPGSRARADTSPAPTACRDS
ncbi:hypothetical protein PC116_g16705 [Phytophthora cactorum]|uniref:Uncharacterized protein n=1 Tax=Phytophthora cactorum TaxID=29920 RepID=A0A8T1KHJ3_9STRA|nr:hypothetical protein Pcac1_g22134 [Phytophthora cactorum]KAG2907365.1 hypothetical protein PC115_g13966 [Phytophthora cactorum]KAG2977279.1 hypothetical protein PC118_g12958 [Phytophthora cactorum]KAG3055196.1 hypothetical protein PC121_g15901 [Phytophthora cactorum]KAG3074354.1 hypothetical protein PC122_g14431 [Phytophthora cactorum]